jgi:hypothetical protein
MCFEKFSAKIQSLIYIHKKTPFIKKEFKLKYIYEKLLANFTFVRNKE